VLASFWLAPKASAKRYASPLKIPNSQRCSLVWDFG
jgi:hypothetical protein